MILFRFFQVGAQYRTLRDHRAAAVRPRTAARHRRPATRHWRESSPAGCDSVIVNPYGQKIRAREKRGSVSIMKRNLTVESGPVFKNAQNMALYNSWLFLSVFRGFSYFPSESLFLKTAQSWTDRFIVECRSENQTAAERTNPSPSASAHEKGRACVARPSRRSAPVGAQAALRRRRAMPNAPRPPSKSKPPAGSGTAAMDTL